MKTGMIFFVCISPIFSNAFLPKHLQMKLTRPFPIILAIFILLSAEGDAQSFVSLSTGISKDINNESRSFYHIPISLQWKPFSGPGSPLFFEFDYDIPFTCKSAGNAYTLNPSLPEKVTLQENIHPYIFTTSIGFRIHLYTNKKNNSFYLNLLSGFCNQNFKVEYKNYDKVNYEVLNPDINRNAVKLVLSIAAVYNFHKRKQDMLLMLHLQSPLLTSQYNYPLSYQFIAPLQLTFGYNLFYNKRK